MTNEPTQLLVDSRIIARLGPDYQEISLWKLPYAQHLYSATCKDDQGQTYVATGDRPDDAAENLCRSLGR